MKRPILGNIRAENDIKMLDEAFLETDDYKAIINSPDRSVVVGRRGTGKSALVYSLDKYWRSQNKTWVISIVPGEAQIIGLRDIVALFGDNFLHIKAGSKLAWRYAIYMELISTLSSNYKAKNFIYCDKSKFSLDEWRRHQKTFTGRLRAKLHSIVREDQSPQARIADLGEDLNLDDLEQTLMQLIDLTGLSVRILVDQLDEGYTPDTTGVALVDGFVQALTDFNNRFPEKIHCMVFLRDNIYRAIVQNDPDFTRNIEPHILRLHWDEESLFRLISMRLSIVFDKSHSTDTSAWNKYAARDLHGKVGFRSLLRLTLYRPRDILSLLNDAFLRAYSQERQEIIGDDIQVSAKSISEIRLNDLHKEYETIFPAIDIFTKSFMGMSPEHSLDDISNHMESILARDDYPPTKQADIAFFNGPLDILRRLYGIGFIGIQESESGNYIFCHDGRDPSSEFTGNARILIHPCYWRALNLLDRALDKEESQEIYDEYDIKITSIAIDQRNQVIGALLTELGEITEGRDHAHDFEDWCYKAIKLVFAGFIKNIELHPNGGLLQQRDIVATNVANDDPWKRIHKDYGVRQIIFEVKNYRELKADEYRQMSSYLVQSYGRLGFIITRDNDNNLLANRDLQWARELYNTQNKIVIKLSAKFFAKHLSKMRNIGKKDQACKELDKLLDTYERRYLNVRSRD